MKCTTCPRDGGRWLIQWWDLQGSQLTPRLSRGEARKPTERQPPMQGPAKLWPGMSQVPEGIRRDHRSRESPKARAGRERQVGDHLKGRATEGMLERQVASRKWNKGEGVRTRQKQCGRSGRDKRIKSQSRRAHIKSDSSAQNSPESRSASPPMSF